MKTHDAISEMFAGYQLWDDMITQKGELEQKSSNDLVKDASEDVFGLKETKNQDYYDRKVNNVKKTESERLKEAMKKPEGNKSDKDADEGMATRKSDLKLHDMEIKEKEEKKQMENLHEKMSQKIAGGYYAAQKSSISFLI